MERGDPSYFMGPLILSRTDDATRLAIIDGQQRLATASILLSVIRDRFASLGDSLAAGKIATDFLGSRDRRSGELEPKLQLDLPDRRFFFETVSRESGSPTSASRESHRLMDRARQFFSDQLSANEPDAESDLRSYLHDWVDYLDRSAVVLLAVIAEQSDAFMIFETLNARGQGLAIADLFNNYLYGLARESIEEVRLYWRQSEDRIIDVDEQSLPQFLRHYWCSRHAFVRESDLYRRF
jgi:uncharacterized protein with ParB-like and HNH nuclease domain